MPFGIGTPELIIILVILIFLFGATRLRGLAKAAGESVREFKKATSTPIKNEDEEAIIDAAKKLGIETDGKSIKQIVDEMTKKTQKS
ncbi:MAG: twin-arginine translocase TatA/TatE family subunit [Candidatus Bathyarchaeota archaeon]|nr:MAG: twin-arginine translocase TatA/TatE family subunit [Candidatus Bathyarchaeota archaeon]